MNEVGLQPYLDGEIDGEERIFIAAHLQSCERCQLLAGFEQAFRETVRRHADEPKVLQKAGVFALVMEKGRIAVDPLDWFVDKLDHGDLVRKLRTARDGELPSDAVSGLSDFGALYENARLMRPVPMETQHVLGLVLAAVTPFLPLVFLVMPAREVLRTLARLLV